MSNVNNHSSGRGKSDDPILTVGGPHERAVLVMEPRDPIPASLVSRMIDRFQTPEFNEVEPFGGVKTLSAKLAPTRIHVSARRGKDGVSGGTIRSATRNMISKIYDSAIAYKEHLNASTAVTAIGSQYFLTIMGEIAARIGAVQEELLLVWMNISLETLSPEAINRRFPERENVDIRIDLVTWMNVLSLRQPEVGSGGNLSLTRYIPALYYDGYRHMVFQTQDALKMSGQSSNLMSKVEIPPKGVVLRMRLMTADFGNREVDQYEWELGYGTFGFKRSFAPYCKIHTEIENSTDIFKQLVMFIAGHALNTHSTSGVSLRAVLLNLGDYDLESSTFEILPDLGSKPISQGSMLSLMIDDNRVIEDETTQFTIGPDSVLVMYGWVASTLLMYTQGLEALQAVYQADYLSLSIQSYRGGQSGRRAGGSGPTTDTSVEAVKIFTRSSQMSEAVIVPLYVNMFASRCITVLTKLLAGASQDETNVVMLGAAAGTSTPKSMTQHMLQLIRMTGQVMRGFNYQAPPLGARGRSETGRALEWLSAEGETAAATTDRLMQHLTPLNSNVGYGDVRYLLTCINSTFIIHALVFIVSAKRTYLPWSRKASALTGIDVIYELLYSYWADAEGTSLQSKVYNLVSSAGIGPSKISTMQNHIIDMLTDSVFHDN